MTSILHQCVRPTARINILTRAPNIRMRVLLRLVISGLHEKSLIRLTDVIVTPSLHVIWLSFDEEIETYVAISNTPYSSMVSLTTSASPTCSAFWLLVL